MRLALIGNCAYQALIDDQASVRCCVGPRFDSSFVFGSLLDDERGGEFRFRPAVDDLSANNPTFATQTSFRRFFASTTPSLRSPTSRRASCNTTARSSQRCCSPASDRAAAIHLSGSLAVPSTIMARRSPVAYSASNHVGWVLPDAQLRLTTNAPLTYLAEGRPFALDHDLYMVLTWGSRSKRRSSRRPRRFWRERCAIGTRGLSTPAFPSASKTTSFAPPSP